MRLELTPERIAKLRSVLHYNGLPIDARSVTDDVLAQEGFEVAKKTVGRVSAGTAGENRRTRCECVRLRDAERWLTVNCQL